MAGGGRAADGQPRRLAELKAIRQAALPRVCFQLLFQLQEKGDYNSCLNLVGPATPKQPSHPAGLTTRSIWLSPL